MGKYYDVPYDGEELAEKYFAKDEAAARNNIKDLAFAYNDMILIGQPGKLDQLYDMMYQVYEDADILSIEDTKENLFPGKHTPQTFQEDVEKLCRILDNRELFRDVEINDLNENTLSILELGDALKSKKHFSDEQVKDFEHYLIWMSRENVDELYQEIPSSDPLTHAEMALGNSRANGAQLSVALMNKEFHAADYVKSRVDMLQQFVDSEFDSLEEFFPVYDPRTYDPAKKPDIEAMTEAKHQKDAEAKRVEHQKELEAKHAAFQNAAKERDALQAKVVKAYGETEASVTAAEKLLQQIEASRRETLTPENRKNFAGEMERYQSVWESDRRSEIGVPHGLNEAKELANKLAGHMQRVIQAYPNADTQGLQQKRTEFVNRMRELNAAPELPKLDVEAMQEYDAYTKKFDQATTETSQKLQSRIEEVKNELETIKKAQEEILKQQEALSKADFFGDMEKLQAEQELLNEQQKSLTDRGQQLRDTLKAEVQAYDKQFSAAKSDLNIAKDDTLHLFFDTDRKHEVERNAFNTLNHNADQMRAACQEAKNYEDEAFMRLREPELRAEMETAFYGISDTKAKRTGFFKQKRKDDTAFQNMKAAVEEYFQNGGEANAEKAYGECRNYLSGWMKQDGKLKNGSDTENTRNQGVVRMLELMEKMPDFQKCVDKKPANAEFDGWEMVDDAQNFNENRGYSKLNFKALEDSLEKHAAKEKDEAIHAGRQENSKSFTNLNQRIERKQARERAAQEKAAAKAAKDAAKAAKDAAKAAKKAKGRAK